MNQELRIAPLHVHTPRPRPQNAASLFPFPMAWPVIASAMVTAVIIADMHGHDLPIRAY
jgi:hypothetical protein